VLNVQVGSNHRYRHVPPVYLICYHSDHIYIMVYGAAEQENRRSRYNLGFEFSMRTVLCRGKATAASSEEKTLNDEAITSGSVSNAQDVVVSLMGQTRVHEKTRDTSYHEEQE
ncbi:unnamed protein product, partial [Didymodactylos carnosus]